MKLSLKTLFTVILVIALTVSVLSGCGQSGQQASEPAQQGNKGPVIELSEDDKALFEALGEDLHVIAPEKFSETVSGLSSEDAGDVYQFVGYYQKNEETDMLYSEDGKTALTLNLLYTELTAGDCYSVTGVINFHDHGDEGHVMLDIITVASYPLS